MTKIDGEFLTSEQFVALQAGDQTLFRMVFDTYCGLIQYIVGRCGIDEAQRDDVVQDVFVKFFQSLKQIESPHKIKAWLCVAARNRSIDKLRALRKTDPDALENLADENEAHTIFRREIEIRLVGDLVELIGKEPDGKDFVAFYRDGKTAKEIAAANGEAVSTVTTRLTRLRRKFGDMIRQRIEEVRQSSPF